MDAVKVTLMARTVSRVVSRWSTRALPDSLSHAQIQSNRLTPHLVNSPEQAEKFAEQMIGHKLITKQTGAGGRVCNAVRTLFPFQIPSVAETDPADHLMLAYPGHAR